MDFQLFGLSPTFRVKNRRKFLVKMATITTEYGKLSSNKTRTVYLRIRSGKTEKRINTQVKVLESEISPRTKKIKDFSKARQIEMMRLDWETKINQLGIEAWSPCTHLGRVDKSLSLSRQTRKPFPTCA